MKCNAWVSDESDHYINVYVTAHSFVRAHHVEYLSTVSGMWRCPSIMYLLPFIFPTLIYIYINENNFILFLFVNN